MRFSLALALLAVSCVDAAVSVRARHAMVVTREPHATDAALSVLKSGGNAVDGAIAAGFALAVTHPSAGNIGGGGFLLARMADGRTVFIDFREAAPGKASRDMYIGPDGKPARDSITGWRASGVPGTVRGFEFASRKFGRKPWAEIVRPALELARCGFALSYGQASSLKAAAGLFNRFPESKRVFTRNGNYYEPGDTFAQPELAATLDRIARSGAREFYEGETAQRLARAMQENGGLITLEDLRNYKAIEREPLRGTYRAHEILTAPPPSSGGIGILEMLGILEGTGYEKTGAGSAASIHWVAEAMRRYFADRAEYLGDPDFARIPVAGLLNKNYVAGLRRSIHPERATPSAQVRPGTPAAYESAQTTHYSIVDAEGNAVAVTYTLNGGYGSGVTPPGLGFLLNNEMDDFAAKPGSANMFGLVQGEANAIAPGKRPLSSMTPTIVMRGGKLFLVLGSPGGPRIISSVLETIQNVVDFGMDLAGAVAFPRFHHQWLPDTLYVEPGISPDTVNLLGSRGYTVERGSSGEVEAIAVRPDGWLEGASDPRVEGKAAGY